MFLSSVGVSEDDAGVGFGGGGSVTRAVGTCLDDMHHAIFTGVAADIERVCSHQNASHRLYTRVKLYACHKLPFGGVVGFDGSRLDDHGGVAPLIVLGLVGDGPRHIATYHHKGRHNDCHD